MKMQESGYVANMSWMIQIAVRPRAATFPQLWKKSEKPLFFALLRENGYVANMSWMIQIAARPRAANFPQLWKNFWKTVIFCSQSCGEETTWLTHQGDASVFIVFEEFAAIKLTHVKVFTRSIVQN